MRGNVPSNGEAQPPADAYCIGRMVQHLHCIGMPKSARFSRSAGAQCSAAYRRLFTITGEPITTDPHAQQRSKSSPTASFGWRTAYSVTHAVTPREIRPLSLHWLVCVPHSSGDKRQLRVRVETV